MILTDCAFEHNRAGDGGLCYRLTFDLFSGPEAGGAGGDGGAILDVGRSITVMSDCYFTLNCSGSGAGGSTNTASLDEYSQGGSGGTGGSGGALMAAGPVSIKRCTFVSNQTGSGGAGGRGSGAGGAGETGGPGGAICALDKLNLTSCLSISNQTGRGGAGGPSYTGRAGSGGSGGSGGAVFAAGAPRLNDCTFTGNWAGCGGQGGAITRSSYPFFTASGGGAGGYGGALYCQSNLAATNCLFTGNQAGDAGLPGFPGWNDNFSSQPSTSGSDGGQGGGVSGTGPIILHACTLEANVGGNGSAADAPWPAPRPEFIFYTRHGGPGGGGGTGGIYCENRLMMSLCTLTGNVGGSGNSGGESYDSWPFATAKGGPGGSGGPGAVYCSVDHDLVLIGCTIAGNRGGTGGSGGEGQEGYNGNGGAGDGGAGGAGGILNRNLAEWASMINTLVASNLGELGGAGKPRGNTGAPDAQGAFTSLGHNLIGQADGSSGFSTGLNGDLAGSSTAPIDPLLGSLGRQWRSNSHHGSAAGQSSS
jgi:hypothetical protein